MKNVNKALENLTAGVENILENQRKEGENLNELRLVLDKLIDVILLVECNIIDLLHNKNTNNLARDEIIKCIFIDSKRPESWIRLANHQRNFENDLNSALLSIESAISLAEKERCFLIQTNIEKISILSELNDIDEIEKCISRIMSYDLQYITIDSGPNIEFIDKLRNIGVSASLIDNYIEKFRSGNDI